MKNTPPYRAILLNDIRSVHNVGSIFRTADTVGIHHVCCAGTTPTPIDRFGRARNDFAKVSLGAESSVSWEHTHDAVTYIRAFKKAHPTCTIIALEQSPRSVDYKSVHVAGDVLIILGNEVNGVDPTLLELCDIIAEIPMKGSKESLNVSVSAGIFLFRLLDR